MSFDKLTMRARVGQKGSLSYVWAPVGSRPAMVRDNRHANADIFGAICPARGVGAALILPPYAPELNPMENVWQFLRANKLCATVWDSYDDILDACA